MSERVTETAVQNLALPALTPEAVLGRLFGSEFRLGWVFRDRNQFFQRWTHPEPPGGMVEPRLARNARMSEARFQDLAATVVAWVLVGGSVGAALAPGSGNGGAADERGTFVRWLVAFAAGAAIWVVASLVWRHQARERYRHASQRVAEIASNTRGQWSQARDHHHLTERERIDQIPEWGPVQVTDQLRVDVFGGSLRSWCGLLTTYVTSVARPSRRVITLDLTGSEIAEESCLLCEKGGLAVNRVLLPDALSSMMSATDLVDLVVQAIHGADRGGRQDDRIGDLRVLTAVSEELKPLVTVRRLRDGLRVLLRTASSRSSLSDDERTRIAGDVFPETYIERAHERIRVLEAYLDQLIGSGADQSEATEMGHADLDCLMLAQGARMAVSDLATRAAVHCLITAARGGASAEVPRVIVIAGADKVPEDLLEWLWKACEQRRIQLIAMFHHLRDEPARFIGGGRTVAFMRLGNQSEAETAANFIGREYKFELSQLTEGFGGSSNETAGTQSGASESQSRHNILGLFFDIPTSRADTFSTNWGSNQSFAESTNWHSDQARQRVYEHRVDPSELQSLPEYAMLLVKHQVGGPRLLAVECSPDILTLPRVSMSPLTLNSADRSGGLKQLLGDRGVGSG